MRRIFYQDRIFHETGGDWSIQFPDQLASIKTGAIVNGECWLAIHDKPDPVHLTIGDCFLLPGGCPFRLARDLSLPPVAAIPIFAAPRHGGVACLNGGVTFRSNQPL